MYTTVSVGQNAPIVLRAGDTVTVKLSADASGLISVPGEGVAQTIASSAAYTYGPYLVAREVIIALTSGTAALSNSVDGSTAWTAPQQYTLQSLVSGGWNYVPDFGEGGMILFGDSLTAGTGAGPETMFSVVLPRLLGSSYVNLAQTVSAGVSGDRIDQILTRMQAVLDANPQAATVVIESLANDANQGVETDVALGYMSQAIQLAKRYVKRVLVYSVPPRRAPATYTNATRGLLRSYRAAAKALADSLDVAFCDLDSVLADPTTGDLQSSLDSGDGLHPNTAGHWLMANAGAAALREKYSRLYIGMLGEGIPNLIGNSKFLTDLTGWTQSAGGTQGSAFSTVDDPYGLLESGRMASISSASGTGAISISRAVTAAASDTWAVGDTMVLGGSLYIDDSVMTAYANKIVTGGALICRIYVQNQSSVQIASVDLKGGPRSGPIETEFVVPAGTTGMTFGVSCYNGSAGAMKLYAGDLRLFSKTKYPRIKRN